MLKKSNIIYVFDKRDDEPRCLSVITRLRHNFGEVFVLVTFDGKK